MVARAARLDPGDGLALDHGATGRAKDTRADARRHVSKSKYTADRTFPGAFDGETVTRAPDDGRRARRAA